MRVWVVVLIAVICMMVFGFGIGAGIWFSQHYRIVPVTTALQTPPAAIHSAPPIPSPPLAASSRASAAPLPSPAGSSKLFLYQFTPGETVHYALDASIEGTGMDLGTGSPVRLNLDSQMALQTEAVDAAGTGALRLDFATVDMTGDFMGSPVQLHQGPDGTQLQMDSKTKIDTNQGISLGVIPQLEFFKQPIEMHVARSGEILDVTGLKGLEQMLAPMTRVSPQDPDFTSLQPNAQWVSKFAMPIPGLSDGVPCVATYTFLGYQPVNGHQCATVRQDWASDKTGGALSSPANALGDALNISMPKFNLAGTNMIYFDMTNGKLVRTDLDLNLSMKLGAQLQPLADLLRMYGDVLGGIDGQTGTRRNQASPPPQSPDSLDLGVRIKATLAMQE